MIEVSRDAVSSPFRYHQPVLVNFSIANVTLEVLHQVGEIPHGFLPISVGGVVTRTPGRQWTKDLAYLQCDTIDPQAVILFVVLREEPINVNP